MRIADYDRRRELLAQIPALRLDTIGPYLAAIAAALAEGALDPPAARALMYAAQVLVQASVFTLDSADFPPPDADPSRQDAPGAADSPPVMP